MKDRLRKAASTLGIELTYDEPVYLVSRNGVTAKILLPATLALELKAVDQLLTLAEVLNSVDRVEAIVAMPDFHVGPGVPIGSIVVSKGAIIPIATGKDIGCGMRLHALGINRGQFLSKSKGLVALLRGDYLLGTRDVVFSARSMEAVLADGLLGWIDTIRKERRGMLQKADVEQLAVEIERVEFLGSLEGSLENVPDSLFSRNDDIIRDAVLGTIGRGNHFVEFQVVSELYDKAVAHSLGLKVDDVAVMIHSGSRALGIYLSDCWDRVAKAAWPKGVKHPKLFPLIGESQQEEYKKDHNTACNYAFLNRLLLAELARSRCHEVYGESLDAPLVSDSLHNFATFEDGSWTVRKGASLATEGSIVLIPGSMGTDSYVVKGLGNAEFLSSASHGAGRSSSRTQARRQKLGSEGVNCITLNSDRIVEESPASYKPIVPVIECQVQAGLVVKVARLSPMLTFKA